MFDIDMTRTSQFAVVRVGGILESDDEADTISAGLAFIPADDDLVVDLSGLESLTARCIASLLDDVAERSMWSEVVIVSPRADVTMQLVRGGVDSAVPIVHEMHHAASVINVRRGSAAGRGAR